MKNYLFRNLLILTIVPLRNVMVLGIFLVCGSVLPFASHAESGAVESQIDGYNFESIKVTPRLNRQDKAECTSNVTLGGVVSVKVKTIANRTGLLSLKVGKEIGSLPNGPMALAVLNDADGPLTDCAEEKKCDDKPTTLGVASCYASCAVIVLEDCIFEDCQ